MREGVINNTEERENKRGRNGADREGGSLWELGSEACNDSAVMEVGDITISLDYHISMCSLFY